MTAALTPPTNVKVVSLGFGRAGNEESIHQCICTHLMALRGENDLLITLDENDIKKILNFGGWIASPCGSQGKIKAHGNEITYHALQAAIASLELSSMDVMRVCTYTGDPGKPRGFAIYYHRFPKVIAGMGIHPITATPIEMTVRV